MNLKWQIAQRIEILWWRNYLRAKPTGAYLTWKQQYWRDFLEKHGLAVAPKARVLDAGCGPAGMFTVLPTQDVTAIDPLLDRYEATLDHFDPAHYPNVTFVNQQLEDLDAHEAFDTIFCLNAINHVADLERSLDRLIDALKPGGQLVLSIDVHNHALLKRLFRTVPGDILHPHQHSLDDYEQMILARGGKIEQTSRHHRQLIFSYYVLVISTSPHRAPV